MDKITTANRRFFLKWLPFNFCDRFCERCDEFQDVCKIYQDDLNFKIKCQIERKDPNDFKVIFEHVGETMAKTMQMLQEMMKKEGIKLTEADERRYMREEETARKIIKSHSLFKKCQKFCKELAKFLDNFAIPIIDEQILQYLQNELGELCFYCHLVLAKARRALNSQIDEQKEREKFSRPDSLISATLGYWSLLACTRSLEVILNLTAAEKSQAAKISEILEMAKQAKDDFEKAFPKVKNFREKIIFHGKV